MSTSKKLALKPLGGRIVVEVKKETTTPSGLVISDTAKGEKPQQGTVVALGTGRLSDQGDKIPFNVKVGDSVFFKKYAPDELEVEGETYLVMDESDVLAVLD